MARILVVDDQPQFLKMLDSLLSQRGHLITLAVDAYDAIEKVKAQPYEMVITDATMPGGANGFDLVKTLRADPLLKDLLVILLTGRREKRDVERGIESGVDDYCIKPIDPDLFLAKVDALLSSKNKNAMSFPECRISEADEYKNVICITGVSEVGMTLKSTQPFAPGTKIMLNGKFFEKIGIQNPTLRIMTCEASGTDFITRVQYIGVSESSLQPLRMWIRGRTLTKAG